MGCIEGHVDWQSPVKDIVQGGFTQLFWGKSSHLARPSALEDLLLQDEEQMQANGRSGSLRVLFGGEFNWKILMEIIIFTVSLFFFMVNRDDISCKS